MLDWRHWAAVGLVVTLGGCGGLSAQQVAKARDAVYETEFEVVWSAAREELFDRYGLERDDPEDGLMQSDWTLFDAAGAKKPVVINPGDRRERVVFVRMTVRVVAENGSGRWRVRVKGEAAEYTPGMKPAPRKGGDEPRWLPSKVDALSVAIYERLKGHSVALHSHSRR